MINIVINDIISLHKLGCHLIIDQNLVHFIIEHLHLLGHFGGIELTHLLAHDTCHVIEGIYHFLVILHGFYLLAH